MYEKGQRVICNSCDYGKLFDEGEKFDIIDVDENIVTLKSPVATIKWDTYKNPSDFVVEDNNKFLAIITYNIASRSGWDHYDEERQEMLFDSVLDRLKDQSAQFCKSIKQDKRYGDFGICLSSCTSCSVRYFSIEEIKDEQ